MREFPAIQKEPNKLTELRIEKRNLSLQMREAEAKGDASIQALQTRYQELETQVVRIERSIGR